MRTENQLQQQKFRQIKQNVLEHIRTWHIAKIFLLEGSTSIYIQQQEKRLKVGGKPAQRWHT
jgi:hypothetical protein